MQSPSLRLPFGGTVEFMYHMFGADIGNLTVRECIDTSNCSIIWNATGQQQNAATRLAGGTSVEFGYGRGCAQCGHLGGDQLALCGQCRVVRYCSKECQRKHWKGGHKAACKAVCANLEAQ